jgi:hypothetical protein
MPIAIDPQTRIPVVLDSDKDKENPPTFYVRPLTMREMRSADSIDERVQAAAKVPGEDTYAPLVDGIRMGLVDWAYITGLDGKPIPFSLESIEDVLSIEECFELMRKIIHSASLLREDKKKSESQPLSSSDSSVSSALEESVSTAPAN